MRPLAEDILALEERLLTAEVRASPALLDGLLSDGFREFGASGRVYDKASIVPLLVDEPRLSGSRTIVAFRVEELASGVALATYRLGGAVRSSIWRREAGTWRLLFHQGTPSMPR